jgi:hypothetical protein
MNDRCEEQHPAYVIAVTDLPSVITTVKRGGKTKRVRDYGRAGPLEHWTFQMAIAGVARDIDWKKVE